MFWVVMTSLRRDEAAFSPKLFSTDLTLQHYRDLLLPPDNVPFIVRDLSSMIALFPPYDDRPMRDVVKGIERKLERLETHLRRTEEYGKTAFDLERKIDAGLKESFGDLVGEISKGFERVLGELPKGLECDERAILAVGFVSKRVGKTDWIPRSCGSPNDVLTLYERELGVAEKEMEKLKKDLERLEGEVSILKSKASDLSLKYTSYLESIRALYGDLKGSVLSLERALEISGKNEFSLEDLKDETSKVLKLVGDLEDLEFLDSVLSRLLSSVSKAHFVSDEGVVALKNLRLEIESILGDMEYQLGLLKDVLEDLKRVDKAIRAKEVEVERIRSRYERLRSEYDSRLSKMGDLVSRAYTVYLRSFLEEKLEKISSMRSFSKGNLVKLQVYSKSLRSRLREAQGFGVSDDVISSIESLMNLMGWASDYRAFSSAVSKLRASLPKLIDSFGEKLSSLKSKWRKLLELASSGVKLPPKETDEMYEILGSVYEGRVSSSLGIAMRESRTLADSFPLKDLRSDFKRIDSALYRIQQIWEKKPRHFFLRWVLNSVVVAGSVALITTFVCALAAYPFSRMRFRGRRYGIMALLLIQMFPAIMYMVALYGMLKFLGERIPWLGLDTIGGLVFVYLGGIAFNMYLMKGYYDTIPSSLEESAMIDGATRFQTFWLIIVPLARPILAVVVILTFIGTFNEFVLARIVLQDVKNYTYALGLWSFSTGPFETEWGLFTAAALMGMLPMVILFLSMQRFLISGLTKGSVKG